MKRCINVLIAGVVMLVSIGVASASQKDDAKSLVKKAAAYMKENGKEKAIAEFNNPQGKFVKGELYIFVFDHKGNTLAHGANPKLIGKNMYDLKDPDGVYFTRGIITAAQKGGGWAPKYKWTNPASKKIETKTTYAEPVDDLAIGCGVYE